MQTTKKPSGPRNEFHAFPQTLTIGIDLGDRFGHYCILDQKGIVVEEGRVKMTRKEVTVHFQRLAAARIAMEAGNSSGWAIGFLAVVRILLRSVAACICRRESPTFSLRS